MEGVKNVLKSPNDKSVASFLFSLYSILSSRNNNSGQREEQVEGEEYNVPLSREVADSPSRDRSPSHDWLFVKDDVPPYYQCEDMEAIYQGESDVTKQHNDIK